MSVYPCVYRSVYTCDYVDNCGKSSSASTALGARLRQPCHEGEQQQTHEPLFSPALGPGGKRTQEAPPPPRGTQGREGRTGLAAMLKEESSLT